MKPISCLIEQLFIPLYCKIALKVHNSESPTPESLERVADGRG